MPSTANISISQISINLSKGVMHIYPTFTRNIFIYLLLEMNPLPPNFESLEDKYVSVDDLLKAYLGPNYVSGLKTFLLKYYSPEQNWEEFFNGLEVTMYKTTLTGKESICKNITDKFHFLGVSTYDDQHLLVSTLNGDGKKEELLIKILVHNA